MRLRHLLQNRPGAVGAAVVHHHDFVRDLLQAQFQMRDAPLCARCSLPRRARESRPRAVSTAVVRIWHGWAASRFAQLQPVGMCSACSRDLFENRGQRRLDAPAEIAARARADPSPSREYRTAAPESAVGVCGRSAVAPRGQLRQRHRIRRPPPTLYIRSPAWLSFHLASGAGGQIARMKRVAHLMARSVEADISQRPPAQVRVHPIGKNALVRRAELPGARQHAAAIDPHREIERVAIFERHRFRSQLGAAVKRNRSGVENSSPMPCRRDARRQRLRFVQRRTPRLPLAAAVRPAPESNRRGWCSAE